MLGWSQFTKGHNSVKTVNVVMVLNLCTPSDVLYICTKFQENISKWSQFTKRLNSVKTVDGVIRAFSDFKAFLYILIGGFKRL